MSLSVKSPLFTAGSASLDNLGHWWGFGADCSASFLLYKKHDRQTLRIAYVKKQKKEENFKRKVSIKSELAKLDEEIKKIKEENKKLILVFFN